jgi:hypothetical protein
MPDRSKFNICLLRKLTLRLPDQIICPSGNDITPDKHMIYLGNYGKYEINNDAGVNRQGSALIVLHVLQLD